MLRLELPPSHRALNLLCIGAHSDDLEIGCAGTVVTLLTQRPEAMVTWVVLSAGGERATEARLSANALLRGTRERRIMLGEVADGRFPSSVSEIKDYFEQIKRETQPDVILTHRLDDRHQDHRTTAELTWQTWRNHLVLEYEIPKYEGDLGLNNLYVSFGSKTARRKVCHLMRHFGTQRRRAWFRPETFQAVMQLRAVECGGRVRFAEAFMARKLVF